MRKLALFVLLAAVMLLNACSDGNSDSPSDTSAHPVAWFSTHPEPALSTDPDFSNCKSCHGADLAGSGDAVSCFSCHSYNAAPPFSIHPLNWADPYLNHRGFAATDGTASCTACHGQNLQGRQTAPSCFAASFNGRSCHPGGPGDVPHPLDGSYLSGANHGPDAKSDLTFCQSCHGQPGGPGSNPRFNVGMIAVGGNGCETCHGINYAHPQAWAGPNATFHYTAANIQAACTICHGVNLDGVGGVGVSCLGCHTSATTFSLDCSFCHGYPPDGSADLDVPIPVPHRTVADIIFHGECSICHGMSETPTGGNFSPTPNYTLFNSTTETLGDHWDGNISMNSGFGYNSTNFGCDAASCHGNDTAHQLSDSGLPVTLEAYIGGGGGGGGGGVHALDGSFLLPSNHGPAAKGLTTVFPNGMLDCQPCHAQTGGPGSNPRFNVGINSQGGIGCEGCHNDFTAHPAAGGTREDVPWYDVGVMHSDVNGFSTMCALCHGATLGGGIGPACTNCHTVDPVANPSSCISCHNTPPDGAVRPNREGRHGEGRHQAACATCHDGVGVNTVGHFDQSPPADVVIQAAFGEPQGAGVYDPTTGSCSNITCHGGSGTSEGPWYQ
jgi:hypothetical protein